MHHIDRYRILTIFILISGSSFLVFLKAGCVACTKQKANSPKHNWSHMTPADPKTKDNNQSIDKEINVFGK